MNNAIPSVQNLEEAAGIASEFVSSLDNLPNEVRHLLSEMRQNEKRSQELLSEISKDQLRYIKHTLRQNSTIPLSPATPTATENGNIATSTSSVGSQLDTSPRARLPARIAASYNEIEALSDEKIRLSRRLIDLLTRTRSRLDADVNRVRSLQGEPLVDESRGQPSPYSTRKLDHPFLTGINSVAQINESLRNALGAASASTDTVTFARGAPAASAMHYNKRRRLTTHTSIKLTPPTAPAVTQTSTLHSRSRQSRQSHPRPQTEEKEEEDLDADAEGEDDFEGEEGEEDPTLYCFCQKQSFGDMIGCDNPDCPYQWFHITCVGVKTPLPDKWYCPECIKTKGGPERRKGRKK